MLLVKTVAMLATVSKIIMNYVDITLLIPLAQDTTQVHNIRSVTRIVMVMMVNMTAATEGMKQEA